MHDGLIENSSILPVFVIFLKNSIDGLGVCAFRTCVGIVRIQVRGLRYVLKM